MGTLVKNGINYTGAEGGSTTPTNLNGLTDVEISSPVDGQGLVYDSSTAKWKNGQGGVDTAKVYLTDDTLESTLADNDKFPFYDTSASGKRNITFQNFKSYISMPVMGTFSKGDLYSTTEKVIGCWRDGRPIYQKTISIGGLKSHNTAHGISNLKEVVDTECVCVSSSPSSVAHVAFSGSWAKLANISVAIAVSSTNIELTTANSSGSDYDVSSTYASCYATLRYTKTTDAANSFNYASENDYSTTEKIVGTWIDGSMLYQRTFTGTVPSAGDAQVLVSSFSYASKIKEMKSLIYTSSGYNFSMGTPYTDSNDTTKTFCPFAYNGQIVAKVGSAYAGMYYVLTVKYIH